MSKRDHALVCLKSMFINSLIISVQSFSLTWKCMLESSIIVLHLLR